MKLFIFTIVISLFFTNLLFSNETKKDKKVKYTKKIKTIDETENLKVKISGINYSDNSEFDEKIMRTFLGFKEGSVYSFKNFKTSVDFAKLRFDFYGIFKKAEINYEFSKDSSNDISVNIELKNGRQNRFSTGSYWFTWNRYNWLNRGDELGISGGLNENIFRMKSNFPSGVVYFNQETGYRFRIKTSYFPFYPLLSNEDNYVHNIFSNARFGFKTHPDLDFGFLNGITVNFLNHIKNYQNPNSYYDFNYKRTGFLFGSDFTADLRYLRNKYYAGILYKFSGGVNLDALNQTTFFPISNELSLYIYPNEYVRIITKARLYNQFYNVPDFLKFNINDNIYQRGTITEGTTTGNFLFLSNADILTKFYTFDLKITKFSLGCHFFYDTSMITNYENFYTNNTKDIRFNHTLGGGLWLNVADPMFMTIFFNFGYSIFGAFSFSVILKFGEI